MQVTCRLEKFPLHLHFMVATGSLVFKIPAGSYNSTSPRVFTGLCLSNSDY